MKLILSFFCLLLFPTSLPGASLEINEILVRLQTVIDDEEGLQKLIAGLEEVETRELENLLKEFDPSWEKLRGHYWRDYESFVKKSFTGEARREAKAAIRDLREQFFKVYRLGEGAMKPRLKSESMPALMELRKIVMPTSAEILATAPPELQNQRKIVLALAKFRDAIIETAILQKETNAGALVLQAEEKEIFRYQDLPRDGIRVLEENEEIAEEANLPEAERKGIRELNEWRLLLGLNALLIDPGLCEASRGHSQDMKEHQFFAHQSPLPGKTTPWDRAAQAGTKSSGENIYTGSSEPASANQGWFFSPGHHKNMFKGSHRFIGLGHFQKYWTQMFG